ncbi:hypothetical protein [Nocardiopsis sp. FR26]|uniref:hypothetical protein n=1 Tax=Nocardiopsis sp. FR26 TaxID=2605987 RepID=UPI00135C052A|nr:hypothetical protein [Nocardiopsis sp. FR26]
MTTTGLITHTADSIRRSYAWELMEEARRQHNAALRDLNYARAQYRTHGGAENAAAVREADRRYLLTLRATNHHDGEVASLCMRDGLDPDAVIPEVDDNCPTCHTEVHATGCACTD